MTYSLRARGVVHDDQPALGGDGLLGRGEARGGGEGARGQGVHGKARERGRVLEWRATATATARDPLWITWFRIREEIYPVYDPWVRELCIDARVIHACVVCVAHGVCRWMSMGSGALVGWNVKIFSSGWVLFWRRD